METGRIIKPAPSALITSESANLLQRKRQEKAARLLRERIAKAHNSGKMDVVKGSAEAFAESGALLYEEIVLDPTAYPRDRVDTWEKLGKYAGVLPSDMKRQDTDTQSIAQAAAVGAGVAAGIAQVLRDVLGSDNNNYRKHDIVDGQATDSGEAGGGGEANGV